MILGLLNRLRNRLARGAELPLLRLRASLRIERTDGAKPAAHAVFRNTLRHLVTRFPELKRFVHPATDTDARACMAALDFVHDYLPLIYEGARETHLRTLLTRLRNQVTDEGYYRQLTLEIARSDLRSGVPERATILLGEPVMTAEDADLIRRLRADIELFERRYGALAGLIPSLDTWRAIPGDVRGQSLVAYFEANRDALRGKRILHVAPEQAVQRWFGRERAALAVEYVTVDPFLSQVDLSEDLTSLQLGDATFDLVICHRVLEHVLDDAGALREIHRVLKPSGVLNFSVPQSLNIDATNEWIVPDASHDHHVRQYGNDLDDRLRHAGFAEVTIERFLLDRTREQHVAQGTYPLRMYVCTKARAA